MWRVRVQSLSTPFLRFDDIVFVSYFLRAGEIVNLMASDATRLQDVFMQVRTQQKQSTVSRAQNTKHTHTQHRVLVHNYTCYGAAHFLLR